MPIPPGSAFYNALALRESGGDPKVVNKFGFMGLYQMGRPALTDVGYIDPSTGNWTGKDGISSQDDFLNNTPVQNDAVRRYYVKLWSYIPSDVRSSVGTQVGGVDITDSGLLAGAHLLGQGGVTRFIRSKGQDDPVDGLGTKCSDYIKQFGGYD
jgi:hypothetical protein